MQSEELCVPTQAQVLHNIFLAMRAISPSFQLLHAVVAFYSALTFAQSERQVFESKCAHILGEAFGRAVSVKAVEWREGDHFSFSPDGKYVIANSRTSVFLHDGRTGKFQTAIGHGLDDPEFSFNGKTFSADGNYLALSSDSTGDVHIFNVKTGKPVSKILGPDTIEFKNSLVQFLPNSMNLVVVNPVGECKIFDLNGALLQNLAITPHLSHGVQFAASADGRRFAIAMRAQDDGNDLTVVFTRADSGGYERTLLFESSRKETIPSLPGPTEESVYRPFISNIGLTAGQHQENLVVLYGNSGKAVGFDLTHKKIQYDTATGSMILTNDGGILSIPVPMAFSTDGGKMGRITLIDPLLSGETQGKRQSPYQVEIYDSHTGGLHSRFSPPPLWDSLRQTRTNIMPEVVDGGISKDGKRVFLLYPARLTHERFALVDFSSPESPQLLNYPTLLPNGIEEMAIFSPDGDRLLIKPHFGWPLIIDLSK